MAALSEPFSKVSSLGPLQNMPESDKEKERETQKTRERERHHSYHSFAMRC